MFVVQRELLTVFEVGSDYHSTCIDSGNWCFGAKPILFPRIRNNNNTMVAREGSTAEALNS